MLKDYLRELPFPLISKNLYEAVLESMTTRPLRIGAAGCENDRADSEHTVSLLDNLPEVEKVSKTSAPLLCPMNTAKGKLAVSRIQPGSAFFQLTSAAFSSLIPATNHMFCLRLGNR